MKTDAQQRNRLAYDKIVESYAERNADMLPYVLDAANFIMRMLQQQNLPTHYLDLGCGVGRDMVWFSDQGIELFGADLSVGMLKEAQKHCRNPLFQLDMRFLPYAERSLGLVWCQAALLHLPKEEVPACLNEINRVLSKDGWLHVAVQKGESEGFETRPYEPEERYYAHYQAQEIADLVENAGFTIHRINEAQARRTFISIEAQKK
jgi:ubiquinone/menaquinone biosynthesis C-methylase UbiE